MGDLLCDRVRLLEEKGHWAEDRAAVRLRMTNNEVKSRRNFISPLWLTIL